MKNTHQMKVFIKLIFLILFTSCKAAKTNSLQTPGSPSETDPNPGETPGSPSETDPNPGETPGSPTEYDWQYSGTIGLGQNENYKLKYPSGVALDRSGNIYVADTNNHRIQIFNSDYSFKETIGTGKLGSGSYEFAYPYRVALDSSDNIYVADTVNNRIQIFSHSTP